MTALHPPSGGDRGLHPGSPSLTGGTGNGQYGKEAAVTDENSPRLAAVIQAASQVVSNANGTTPRHTRGRDGSCRDDCIPCGLDALADALAAYGAGDHQIAVAHRTLAEWEAVDRSGWEAADYAGQCSELAETVRTLLGEGSGGE